MSRAASRSPVVPVLLLAVVLVLDAVAGSRRWPVPAAALLDEPAHLATAVLVLVAVAGPRWLRIHRRFAAAACIASVAIDVDHVPLYAHVRHIAVDGGRPFTHSLSTVAVLLGLALLVRGRRPAWAGEVAGVAVGVALHLFRDLASGPGVSLFWPVYVPGLHLPYGAYAVLLGVAAAAGVARMVAGRRAGRDSAVAADGTSAATGPA